MMGNGKMINLKEVDRWLHLMGINMLASLKMDYYKENDDDDTQIIFDNLEFIVPMKKNKAISPIIPLFKVNPYAQISEDSEDKFFYIVIYMNRFVEYKTRIYIIRKPKLYTDIQFNTINVLPKLDDTKYYHINKFNCLLLHYLGHQNVFHRLLGYITDT